MILSPTVSWPVYKVAVELDPMFGVHLAQVGLAIITVTVTSYFLRKDSGD